MKSYKKNTQSYKGYVNKKVKLRTAFRREFAKAEKSRHGLAQSKYTHLGRPHTESTQH